MSPVTEPEGPDATRSPYLPTVTEKPLLPVRVSKAFCMRAWFFSDAAAVPLVSQPVRFSVWAPADLMLMVMVGPPAVVSAKSTAAGPVVHEGPPAATFTLLTPRPEADIDVARETLIVSVAFVLAPTWKLPLNVPSSSALPLNLVVLAIRSSSDFSWVISAWMLF